MQLLLRRSRLERCGYGLRVQRACHTPNTGEAGAGRGLTGVRRRSRCAACPIRKVAQSHRIAPVKPQRPGAVTRLRRRQSSPRCQADQAAPVRRTRRGAKRRAAGTGGHRSPGGQAKRASVSDVSPQGRDGICGSLRSTPARPGYAGRRTDCRTHTDTPLGKYADASTHTNDFTYRHKAIKLQNGIPTRPLLRTTANTAARFYRAARSRIDAIPFLCLSANALVCNLSTHPSLLQQKNNKKPAILCGL